MGRSEDYTPLEGWQRHTSYKAIVVLLLRLFFPFCYLGVFYFGVFGLTVF